jgi:hypothetical protein
MDQSHEVASVVDSTALIENIINQVIVAFCKPREEPFRFFWDVILDSSVMPLGSKVKVVSAIAHEVKFKLKREELHEVLALRNAFAHHPLNSHQVVVLAKNPDENRVFSRLQVLKSSGKIEHMGRAQAHAAFQASFKAAKESLVGLLAAVKAQQCTGA